MFGAFFFPEYDNIRHREAHFDHDQIYWPSDYIFKHSNSLGCCLRRFSWRKSIKGAPCYFSSYSHPCSYCPVFRNQIHLQANHWGKTQNYGIRRLQERSWGVWEGRAIRLGCQSIWKEAEGSPQGRFTLWKRPRLQSGRLTLRYPGDVRQG